MMPDERTRSVNGLREDSGFAMGGEVIVKDTGGAAASHTLDRVVAHVQSVSRLLVDNKTGASVDGFLHDRAREAELE